MERLRETPGPAEKAHDILVSARLTATTETTGTVEGT
jgi:hypothetical protein